MSESTENRKGSADHKAALDEVTQSTTKVSTGVLLRNGIESLRILSESQFLEVLKRQEARARAALASSGSGTGVGGESSSELSRAYQARWAELRSKHERSLGAIEARMEKLSRAFQGLKGVVGRIEGQSAGDAAEGQPPAAAVARTLSPEAESLRQKALLRQLLLTGEEPR